MKKVILLFVLVCFVCTGCGMTTLDESNSMDLINEVKEISDNYSNYSDVYIIDVREENEYMNGHIREAINIPLDKIDYIELDKNSKIIVYCQSGRRSASALEILKNIGYTNVYDMGGINSWPYDLVS